MNICRFPTHSDHDSRGERPRHHCIILRLNITESLYNINVCDAEAYGGYYFESAETVLDLGVSRPPSNELLSEKHTNAVNKSTHSFNMI